MELRRGPEDLDAGDDHPQGVGHQGYEGARERRGCEPDHAFVEGVDDVVGVGQHADGVFVDGPVEQRGEQPHEHEEDEPVVGLHHGRAGCRGGKVVSFSGGGGDDGLETNGGDEGGVGEHEAETVCDHGEEATQQPTRGHG